MTVQAIIEIKFSEAKRLLRVDEMTVYTAAAISPQPPSCMRQPNSFCRVDRLLHLGTAIAEENIVTARIT